MLNSNTYTHLGLDILYLNKIKVTFIFKQGTFRYKLVTEIQFNN